MNRIIPCLLALGIGLLRGAAQIQPAGEPPSKNLYLFIFDASSSMSKAAPAGRQTIADLIESGLQGQMRRGDDFAVWTFNEQVYTNRFAPMKWESGMRQSLAEKSLAFLKAHPLEKKSRMDRLSQELARAAHSADQLMAIIVSDGEDYFQGTPFDEPLKTIVRDHYRELRRAKKTFVTALVAIRGQLVAYTVGPSGEPIDIGSLNRQLAQVLPAEPPAPLVTNIVTTNIIVYTNLASPTVASVTDTRSKTNDTTSAAAPEVSLAQPATLTNGVSLIAEQTNDTTIPETLGIFTQPPPLKDVKPSQPILTHAPTQTLAAVTQAVSRPQMPKATDLAALEKRSPMPEPQRATNVSVSPPEQKPSAVKSATPVPAKPASVAAPPPSARSAPAAQTQGGPKTTPLASVKPVPKPLATVPLAVGKGKLAFVVFAIVAVGLGLAVFLVMIRKGRRKPHPSFISQSIDKQLR